MSRDPLHDRVRVGDARDGWGMRRSLLGLGSRRPKLDREGTYLGSAVLGKAAPFGCRGRELSMCSERCDMRRREAKSWLP